MVGLSQVVVEVIRLCPEGDVERWLSWVSVRSLRFCAGGLTF